VRVGVIGCGYWGSKHVRVLQQISAVSSVVVVDPRPERRAALAASATGVAAFANLRSALPHIDAAVIAAPPRTHAHLALKALIAGKHVLVEKPMTTAVAGARRLITEAGDRRLTLMVGHTFEYNAAVWKLRDIIDSGELGDIYYINSARLNLGIYQPDVNVVWDLAPHDVSIINYLLRRTPSWVQAWGSRHAQFSQEDVANLRLGYGGTALEAQIHVSWLDPCKVRQMTVVGSRRMAVYNDLADEERVRIYDKGVVAGQQGDLRNPPMTYRHGGIYSPLIRMREPLSVQDQHFIECVTSGLRPRTDGESGLAVVRVLEAAGQSLQRGRPVPVTGGEASSSGATAPLPRSQDLVARAADVGGEAVRPPR
jgi:predicted dehydrogenase